MYAITGASDGLGLALAKLLAAKEGSVILQLPKNIEVADIFINNK